MAAPPTTFASDTAAPSPSSAARRAGRRPDRRGTRGAYPLWFFLPAGVIFLVLFALPTLASLYFSLTRWTIFTTQFIGLENFVQFFREPQLVTGFRNTIIYAVLTSGAKVVLGFTLGVLLTSGIRARGYLRAVVFFPVLVSTVGVGITFQALMDPEDGLINRTLALVGLAGPGWLTDPSLALYSIAAVDVWKGVGIATVIYMAGIVSIPKEFTEAARVDGASGWEVLRRIIVPLSWPATSTVVMLSLIGGLRSFDLIWAMTRGGPGFTSDVIASVIYKQYQAGFYGLSTAGNVILFVVVMAVVIPLTRFFARREVEL